MTRSPGLVGLDTNVLLRALLDDDPSQTRVARELLSELTPHRPGLITSVTLAEVYWNLARLRHLDKSRCLDVIRAIASVDTFEFDDGEGVVRALELSEAGADFPDALIHASFEQFGVDTVFTFDRKASKHLGWTLIAE